MYADTPELRKELCEIGERVYARGFVAAVEGNISARIGPNEVLCTPTMICKGRMRPQDLCVVDLTGKQLSGERRRTSEILLHLEIYKHRSDVQAVVHSHPPHATAFAITRQTLPEAVLPEVEIYLGKVPLAPYAIPGSQQFAETTLPFLESARAILLSNHGMVSFGRNLEEALWRTEILDSVCRTVILSRALGEPGRLSDQEVADLQELRARFDAANIPAT